MVENRKSRVSLFVSKQGTAAGWMKEAVVATVEARREIQK
jgi:hypothetical protein